MDIDEKVTVGKYLSEDIIMKALLSFITFLLCQTVCIKL
jgi:hypothetical protein